MGDWWYLSCRAFTIAVLIRKSIVVSAPPIASWALGLHANKLEIFMMRIGGYRKVHMRKVDDGINRQRDGGESSEDFGL